MLNSLNGLAFIISFLMLSSGASIDQNSGGKSLQSQSLNARIIGGRSVDIFLHPHQISIRRTLPSSIDKIPEHFCGGSIISTSMILTAAHCVIDRKPSELFVAAGSSQRRGSDGVVVKVKQIIIHEKFFAQTFTNDIALLLISPTLPLNNLTIKVIELEKNIAAVGALATVTGWGRTELGFPPTILQEVQVPIIDNESCTEDYKHMSPTWFISDDQLCAGLRGIGGKDACAGDSGGPLVIDGKLVGVVSYGKGCGTAEYPGVYARISHHFQWLREKMAQSNQ